ncbi:heavy-metal-associated domain-containing protein [Lactococcus protaetiae]|uniref:Heavy-metal-associated domain-containing protein n=1 Tax=Lactococcus protaetiae TaxID=2592653 RepID=A0A514Z8D5_9LACT|nr:heavy-metal-associated domain-containing protein [Lactococcus protaetiae]QDK70845.1 heavy-metal-associated domain-containing protein [Lactococcus protaetiae]
MNKIIMKLDELSCPSCMAKIEGAIKQTKGVSTAKVLFNASKVKAEFDETAVTADELISEVEKLGYEVQSTKITSLA